MRVAKGYKIDVPPSANKAVFFHYLGLILVKAQAGADLTLSFQNNLLRDLQTVIV